MFLSRAALAALLAAGLTSGCSSHSSTNQDGGTGEAGRPLDTRGLDTGASSIDGKVAAAIDGRDGRDGRDTSARDASDARDTNAKEAGGAPDTLAGETALRDGGNKDNKDNRDSSDNKDSDNKDSSDNKDTVDAPTNDDGNGDGLGTLDTTPDIPPPPQGTCASPFEIPTAASSFDLTIDTSNADHVLAMPCAGNGRDVVVRFAATDRELVYAHTFGATWNTALFFSQSCETAQPPPGDNGNGCNDDACDTLQSQASAIVTYGWHYLIVSGVNDESGEVVVHFERVSIGNGSLGRLDAGTGTVQGKTLGQSGSSQCEAAGPENSYWWTGCPDYAGGAFHASTCGGATFDTVLALQIPRTQVLACNDDFDKCGMQSVLDATIPAGAGINVVTVDSSTVSNSGNYTLSYTRP